VVFQGLCIKSCEPSDNFDEFGFGAIFTLYLIYIMNKNISYGHLVDLVHPKSIFEIEESPYKPD
jgi:hypothetical protein